MNAADYRRRLKISPAGAYLFCGPEEYLKRRCLEQTRAVISRDATAAAFNIIIMSASDEAAQSAARADEGYIINRAEVALSSPPLFCDKKLVELRGLDIKAMGDAMTDNLAALAALAPPDGDNILIVYAAAAEFDAGTEKRRSKEYQRLGGSYEIVEFGYETPAKLAEWLGRHFAAEGVSASPELCASLTARCGKDMYTLSGEAAKLCSYVKAHGRAALEEDDIARVCAMRADYSDDDFALSDALLSSDINKAFSVLGWLKAKKEKPELIMGGIIGVVSALKTVSELSRAGMTERDIAAKTKIHPFRVSIYTRALKVYTPSRLDRLIELCGDIDLKIKTSGLDNYMLLDRLLSLAAPYIAGRA